MNRLVFAQIFSQDGFPFPYGYMPKKHGYLNKQLIKPIPGIYNIEFMDALSQNEPLIPILTDSMGMVEFTGIYFSQYGPIGSYTLVFICDGVTSVPSSPIKILSTVSQLVWIMQPPTIINLNLVDLDNVMKPIIQILDANSQGIQGKTVNVAIQILTNTMALFPLGLVFDTERFEFSYSDNQGIENLFFRLKSITNSNKTPITLYIYLNF